MPVVDMDPAFFPTEWALQRSLKRLKRGRAPGPNQLPPVKAAGPVFIRQLLLLITKSVAAAREPIQWKNGRTYPLYKGKGSPQQPDSFRCIYISNFTAKLYHHALRVHLADAWTQVIQSLQCGGRARFSTDLAHHVVQAHAQWEKSRNLAHATIYFDLKAAFYSVLRPS